MIAGFIFELSADGTIRHLGPAVTRLTGYSPEELLELNWWRTFFPQTEAAASQGHQDQILNHSECQLVMTVTCKNGSLLDLEVHTALRRGADGSLVRITGFAAAAERDHPIHEVLDGEDARSLTHLSQPSQKYYQTIFEHTLDAVLIVNDEDRFIDANLAACDLLGYRREELLEMKVTEVLPPADRPAYEPLKQNIIDQGQYDGELQLLTRDGALVDVEYHVNAGVLPGLHIAVLHDITARKRTQRALHESEQRYNAIFENSLKTILIADDRGLYVDANSAACRLLGYNRDELLQMSVSDLFAITDQDQFESLWRGFLAEGDQKGEVRLRRKDGTLVDVEYHATANILPGVHLSIMHDVSERVRIQHALAESEERYRQLVKLSPDAIGIQSDGKIEFINSAGARMIGVDDPRELIGKNYMDIIHPDDVKRIRQRKKSLDENNPAPLSEIQITRLDGSTIEIESAAIPFTYQGKSAVLFISRDITARKQAEETIKSFEQRLSTIVNRAPIVLFALDRQGNYTLSEGKGLESLGLGPGELVGRNALQLYGELTVSTSGGETITHHQLVSRVLAGEDITAIAEVNNAVFETHYLPQRDARGVVLGLIGVGTEITDRVLAEVALQESEARYRSLFEDSPISLWGDDFSGMRAYLDALREGGIGDLRAYFAARPEAVFECLSRARILDVNRATLKIYAAATKDDLLGGLDRVLDPGCHRDYAEGLISIAEGRTRFEIETVNRTLQGQPIDIVLSWSVAPGSESTYDKVLVSVFDITERKRIQQAERDQRALAEALRDVSSALNSTLNYEDVLDRILENIERIASFDTADILLVKDDIAQIVRFRGYDQFGIHPDQVLALRFRLSEHGSLHHMVATGLPIVIPDTSEFEAWVDIPELGFIKSFAGAPIRIRGEVTGFLNITSTQPRFYDRNHALRLQALADQAATALHNARLFEQVRLGRERLRALTHQVVTAQEEERRRLSRELHDEAGQSLTVLKIGLMFVHDEIPDQSEALRKQVADAIMLTEDTMNKVRFLAQDLRPPALDAIGLVPTLKDLCEEYAARSNLKVKFVARDVSRLSDEINVGLYRFLQEAMTNVIKHAQAHHVVVKLNIEDKRVRLSVSDDGRGFDQGKTTLHPGGTNGKDNKGIGLLGMQERIELLGGNLEVDSSPGSGTTLVAQVPVEDESLERRQAHDKRRYRR